MKLLTGIDRWVEKISSGVLALALLATLGMCVLNILLRWLNYPVNWFEPFARHLIFLCAFLGGVLATGRKSHIAIDIAGKYLESKNFHKAQVHIERLIYLVSLGTLIWLAWAGMGYVAVEAEFGKAHFLGIHSKYLAGIIPVGVSLIAWRFFVLLITSFSKPPAKHHD